MNTVLTDFLDFFGLDDLLSLGADTTVVEFLGLETCCFIALIFTVVGIRCVMEFIKILTDYKRFS